MGERKYYQTRADLDRERQALDVLLHWLNDSDETKILFDWEKLPEIRYVIDACLHQRKILAAWAEVKGRKGDPFEPKKYRDTWFISLSKIMAGLELYRQTKLPFLLVYVWGIRVFVAQITEVGSLEWNGNYERNDDGDQEPMVYFPNKIFSEIGKISNGNWDAK